ncbi:hypothetical protein Fcan01_23573 [Folsomia candida]|uniref:Uncharacterized protein n=1 Tax=Folsomia candida TaxID=158441 RepID=A0A226D888_FOLCA|nr:hypothetical protein Fcan01_23573 [Folsomia candida]
MAFSQATKNPKPNHHMKSCKCQDCIISLISLLLGVAVLTISILLLLQSLCKHKGESGPSYAPIYAFPFKKSNWMKSSITAIVVASFGIVLASLQILSASILLFITRKYRIVGLAIYLGCHMVIFIVNIICFSLAVSVKAHEHKDIVGPLFWQHYQFRSYTIHNIEGHLYCSVLALNSVYILVTVFITAITLSRFAPRPIYLPASVY